MTSLIIQTIQERKTALINASSKCISDALKDAENAGTYARQGKVYHERACELESLLKFLNGEIDNEQYTFQGLRGM